MTSTRYQRVMQVQWVSVTEKLPSDDRVVLTKGPSGYIFPAHMFFQAARYMPHYRPYSPWQTVTSDSMSDYGFEPTHWSEIPAEWWDD